MGMEEKECLREAKRKRERGDSGLEVRRTGCRITASGGSASGWRGLLTCGTASDVDDMSSTENGSTSSMESTGVLASIRAPERIRVQSLVYLSLESG